METKEGKSGKMVLQRKEKIIAFAELAGYVLYVMWCTYNMHLDTGGLWTGVLSYLFQFVITILLVVKADKQRICDIGLKRPVIWDIPKGLLLGCCMFAAQQLPLLLMGMDYSAYAMAPDW